MQTPHPRPGSPGLRRFLVAEPRRAPAPDTKQASKTRPAESCELCAGALFSGHDHVVDVENRSIECVCRACHLLFSGTPALGGRFRAVPTRYLHDQRSPLAPEEWSRLRIPVSLAFFLRGQGGELTAFYPGPAGATECLPDPDEWKALAAGHPLFAQALPEVEAVVVHCTRTTCEYHLVPIDACYELVGRIRTSWTGFDGGSQTREGIAEFFAGLRLRSTALADEAAAGG